MTKNKCLPRLEKIDFFNQHFYSPEDSVLVIGVNNTDGKCYLQEPLSSTFKEPFFQMPLHTHFMRKFICPTDLGIKGVINAPTENEEIAEISLHIPWKNVVYMVSSKDGEEKSITKKW
jgi:Mrp family chromosome partitioning ATPase